MFNQLLGDFKQLVLLRLILISIFMKTQVQAKLLARFGVTVGIATICRTTVPPDTIIILFVFALRICSKNYHEL